MSDYAELRRNMMDCQLRTRDINDLRILEAMDQLPREAFVPDELKSVVYADRQIGLVGPSDVRGPRAMLSPIALATLIQGAQIKSSDFVLDVGCLTGYSSAVLAHLADSVVALEAVPEMAQLASETLSDLQIGNVAVVEGPLAQGQAKQGPFDVILINGAVEDVPLTLLDQLKDGGRLVTVVMENGVGRAERYIRAGEGASSSCLGDLSAMLLSEFVSVPEFAL